MAFRPEQDIRGASAFEKPVDDPSYATTALNLGAGLLKSYNTRPKTTVKGPTQTDRDRVEFNTLLRNAQSDLSSGMSSDAVSQKYARPLSNLGLNEQQRSVVSNTFGEDIFAVPVQADKPIDIATNLFNEQSNATKSGLIQIELDEAEEAGKPITVEEATQLAVGSFQMNTSAAQVSVIQGNRNFSKGFSGNMQVLDNVSSTLEAILKVEIDQGNFDLNELAAIRASYTMLTSQPAFGKPAGGRNADLWEQMDTKKKSIDAMFDTIEKYDLENATTQAKAFAANIALSTSRDNPLAILAMNSPDMMNKIAAQIAPLTTKELATYSKNTVSFESLDLDPSVAEWYTGAGPEEKPVASTVEDLLMPTSLKEKYSGMSNEEKLETITAQSKLIEGYGSVPDQITNTPEGVSAFNTSIVNQAYLLSTLDNQPAGASLDNLFSNTNIKIIKSLDEDEGNALKAMMTKALNKSATTYGVQAAGNMQTIPDVSLNSKTGAFVFTGNDKGMQSLNAIVDRYYGGDTNALINDGLRARDRIRDRLQLSPDTAAYNTFLASTEILDNSLWKGMVGQLNKVKNIPVRFKQFNDMANKLKVELDVIPEVIGLNPTDRAKIIETIESETLNLGIPLEDIDFDSNAPATPAEPSGEIVTTPIDTVETTPVDRTLTSEQQNAISNISEITRASNEPITTRAGTYSFTKTNKAIETSVKNPIKQALLKGAITVETGGAGPVSERPYPYAQAARIPVWKARMDAVGLGTNATGEEIFNAVYANRNGNGDYASGDGNRYRGRGLIQITGKTTYQGVQDILQGQGINIDLIGNPDLANDNKYTLPVALAFLEYAGLDDTSVDTITTNKLNDYINSGASREIAEDRWEEVIDLLELAGMREKAEELELRNEYAAQEKAGTTADGDIGPNSRTAMTNYLTQQGVTIPQNISDDDLVILVNRN